MSSISQASSRPRGPGPRAGRRGDSPGRHRFALLTAALGGAAVVKSLSMDTTVWTRLAFGGVVAVALLTALTGVVTRRHMGGLVGPLTLFSAWMVLEAVQVPAAVLSPAAWRGGSLTSAATDLIVMLLPALLAVALGTWGASRSQLLRMLFVVGLVGFAGTLVAWATTPQGVRFEAPSVLSIAVAWGWALMPRATAADLPLADRFRWLGWVMVASLVPIAVASGSRTALGVWLLAGLITGLLSDRKLRLVMGGLLLMAAASLALAVPEVQAEVDERRAAVLQRARLATFQSGQRDMSTLARVVEVKDAWETMSEEGTPLTHVGGFGHGASYVPTTNLILVNVGDDGRIHNIHFTPMLVLFRYGAVGLFLYVALLVWILLNAWRALRRRTDAFTVVLFVAVVGSVGDAMVRNSFADPSFSLVIAAAAVVTQMGGQRRERA